MWAVSQEFTVAVQLTFTRDSSTYATGQTMNISFHNTDNAKLYFNDFIGTFIGIFDAGVEDYKGAPTLVETQKPRIET